MRNYRITYLFAIFIGVLFLAGCSSDDDGPEALLPANLVVTVDEDADTEGLIHLTATADFTNFYTFTFIEDGESTVEENNTGEASYRFTTSGKYTVIVRAHATQDQYIEEIKSLDISIGGPNMGTGDFPSTGYSSPLTYSGYDLVWQDEFDGTSLSTTDWNYETGTGNSGWGNNELQYYRQENVKVDQGVLTIEARDQPFNSSGYTSSRITTQNKRSFKYGRIDIRAAQPYGQGLWPALWMLGDKISTVSWPACGEIDIMELVGGNVSGGDNHTHGTIHWSDNGTHASYGESKKLGSGIFADEFHVFSIVWDETAIRWYLDDQQFLVADITPAELSEFHEKFFLIFNVAVGGNWPGSPNGSTVFPQRMYVDYVRVFQKS